MLVTISEAQPTILIPFVTAGHLAPTLGEPVPSQSKGDTWIRVMVGRIQSVRKGHWLSRGQFVQLTDLSNNSGGDPLVNAPWLTNHNRNLETSLRLVNPLAGPQLSAKFSVNPTRTTDQYYTAPLTPVRRKGVTYHPSPASTQGGVRSFGRPPLRQAP